VATPAALDALAETAQVVAKLIGAKPICQHNK
jgi:hypothetical protein